MTRVINLFGGPGTGKSTRAAQIFQQLKDLGVNAELVREYAKEWAWAGRKITADDQDYIGAKQRRRESSLYGKVDVIVTDSPVILSPFYLQYYYDDDSLTQFTLNCLKRAEAKGVIHHNLYLKRMKPYMAKGRYENEEQALAIDVSLRTWMQNHHVPFTDIVVEDEIKSKTIIDHLATDIAFEQILKGE